MHLLVLHLAYVGVDDGDVLGHLHDDDTIRAVHLIDEETEESTDEETREGDDENDDDADQSSHLFLLLCRKNPGARFIEGTHSLLLLHQVLTHFFPKFNPLLENSHLLFTFFIL